MASDQSDKELTRLCIACQQVYATGADRDGDRLFSLLWMKYAAIAMGICRSMLASARARNDVDDVLQESKISIWIALRAGKFNESKSFLPWGNTIVRRRVISFVRIHRARWLSELLLGDDFSESGESSDPSETAFDRETGFEDERLSEATEHLSDEELSLLMNKYVDEMSLEELAQQHSLTPGAIRGRLYRIKKRVQEALGIPVNFIE